MKITTRPTGLRDDVDVIADGHLVGYTTRITRKIVHATSMAQQVYRPAEWSANTGRNVASIREAVQWIAEDVERYAVQEVRT